MRCERAVNQFHFLEHASRDNFFGTTAFRRIRRRRRRLDGRGVRRSIRLHDAAF